MSPRGRSILVFCISLTIALLERHAARADDPCARTDLQTSVSARTNTVQFKWIGQINSPMRDELSHEFSQAKGRIKKVVLVLSSCGGSVSEAEGVIEALKEIKKTHDLETRVEPGSVCASTCIPIFLQGVRRKAALTSAWLFHEVTRRGAIDRTKKRVDRARTERVFVDYYLKAGVSEAWLNELRIMVQNSNYWQTGQNLWESKSGIITDPIDNHLPRATERLKY